MTDTVNGEPRRVAVIVVHGVGDNLPGSTVNYLVDSLCEKPKPEPGKPASSEDHPEADPQNEVYTFVEPDSQWQRATEAARQHDHVKPGKIEPATFKVYGRRAKLAGGGEAAFYELHWADLARNGNTWWHTVKGFARFVFEIPHVVDGFLRGTPGTLGWLLRRSLLLATCFVRGPLAGYSAVMLTGGLIFMSFGWIPDKEELMTLLGLMPEKSAGLAFLLPDWIGRPLQERLAALQGLGSRPAMISFVAGLMLAATAVGWKFRRRLSIAYLAAFVALTCAFYLTDMLWLRPPRYPAYEGFVYLDYVSVMLFGLLMLGLYVFWTRRTTEVGFADLGLFTALWAAFFIVHLSVVGDWARQWLFQYPTIITSTNKTPSSEVHFKAFAIFYPYLSWFWAVWALVMLVAFVLASLIFIANARRWGEYHRGIFAALALAVAQACVWLTALPAIGVMHMDDVLCRGSLSYATVKQPVSCQTKLDRNNEALDLIHRMIVHAPTAVETMPQSMRQDLEKAVRDRFPRTLDFDMLKAMRELSMSFIWHGMILIVAGSIAVMVGFYRHVRTRRAPTTAAGPVRLPRLIINNLVLASLLAFGIVNIVLCFAWVEGFGVLRPVLHELGITGVSQIDVPAEVVQMAMLTTTGLLVIAQLPQISTPLSGVLQIMQGLIDHHYRSQVSLFNRAMTLLGRSAAANEKDEPIRRAHIHQRMEVLVRNLVADKGFNDIVLLSHSQGSVIVYDFLRTNPACLGRPAHVLTVGSPLGAIYGYYFNEYGDMDAALAGMAPHVASWTNLYRSDDAIAGPILPAERAGETAAAAAVAPPPYPFTDVRMPPGGHLRYWEAAVVCKSIRDLLMGRSPVAARPPATAATPSRWKVWQWRRAAADVT